MAEVQRRGRPSLTGAGRGVDCRDEAVVREQEYGIVRCSGELLVTRGMWKEYTEESRPGAGRL